MLPIPHFRAFFTGSLSSTRKAFILLGYPSSTRKPVHRLLRTKRAVECTFVGETNNEKEDLLEELRKKTNLSVLNYKKKSETNGTLLFRGENKTFKLKVFSDNKNLMTMVLIFLSICKVYFKIFP